MHAKLIRRAMLSAARVFVSWRAEIEEPYRDDVMQIPDRNSGCGRLVSLPGIIVDMFVRTGSYFVVREKCVLGDDEARRV